MTRRSDLLRTPSPLPSTPPWVSVSKAAAPIKARLAIEREGHRKVQADLQEEQALRKQEQAAFSNEKTYMRTALDDGMKSLSSNFKRMDGSVQEYGKRRKIMDDTLMSGNDAMLSRTDTLVPWTKTSDASMHKFGEQLGSCAGDMRGSLQALHQASSKQMNGISEQMGGISKQIDLRNQTTSSELADLGNLIRTQFDQKKLEDKKKKNTFLGLCSVIDFQSTSNVQERKELENKMQYYRARNEYLASENAILNSRVYALKWEYAMRRADYDEKGEMLEKIQDQYDSILAEKEENDKQHAVVTQALMADYTSAFQAKWDTTRAFEELGTKIDDNAQQTRQSVHNDLRKVIQEHESRYASSKQLEEAKKTLKLLVEGAATLASNDQAEYIIESVEMLAESIQNRHSSRDTDEIKESLRQLTQSIEKMASDTNETYKMVATERTLKEMQATLHATEKAVKNLQNTAKETQNTVNTSAEEISKIGLALPGLISGAALNAMQAAISKSIVNCATQEQLNVITATLPSLCTGDALKQLGEELNIGIAALATGKQVQEVMSSMKSLATGNTILELIGRLQHFHDNFSAFQNDTKRQTVYLAKTNYQLAPAIATQSRNIANCTDIVHNTPSAYSEIRKNHQQKQELEDENADLHDEKQYLGNENHSLHNNYCEIYQELGDVNHEKAGLEDDLKPLREVQTTQARSRPSRAAALSSSVQYPVPIQTPTMSPLLPAVDFGDLVNIKAWTGTQLVDFADLSVEVRGSLLEWSKTLPEDWFKTLSRRRTSCIGRSANACLVPTDDVDVACNRCVGGRVFCVRRRSREDDTPTLFPVHPLEGQGTWTDVAFWKNASLHRVRPWKGLYTQKAL